LGVSLQSVSGTIGVLVGGQPVSKYKERDEQYDVWLRAERSMRDDREAIARMVVPSAKAPGGTVPLASVVRFEDAVGPNTIDRFSRQRQVVVSANMEGKGLGEAVQEMSAHMKEKDLRGMPLQFISQLNARRLERELRMAFFCVRVHVHDSRGAVRELRSPDHDPDGGAAHAALRAHLADAPAHAARRVRDDRAVHAVRHREEERHLQVSTRINCANRAWIARRRSSRRTACDCGRF
jgi:hypothetical protein